MRWPQRSLAAQRCTPLVGIAHFPQSAHIYEFSSLLAGAVGSLVLAGNRQSEVVDYLWEGLAQPSFKPMYGRATQADRALVRMSTGGQIRSREILPEYEDED